MKTQLEVGMKVRVTRSLVTANEWFERGTIVALDKRGVHVKLDRVDRRFDEPRPYTSTEIFSRDQITI